MILIGRGLDFDAKSERLIGKRLRKFRSRMLCSCQGVREEERKGTEKRFQEVPKREVHNFR